MSVLELSHITAGYGRGAVLHDVDLRFDSAGATAILGRNGAGKTTIARTIAGLLRPSAGTVRLDGRDLTRLDATRRARRGIALVREGRGVFTDLTVRENLRMGGYVVPARLRQERTDAALELFPVLRERARQRAGNLSGGEQQMLAIARALIRDPEVLVLDEPTTGLAPAIIERLYEVFRAVFGGDKIVVLIEQDAALARRVCRDCYVIANGVVRGSGPIDDVTTDAALLDSYLGYVGGLEPPSAGLPHPTSPS